MSFKEWLKKEMAEIPQPGSDWGYSHSGEYKGRPTKNQWIKRGQRAQPAFTTSDELYDKHRKHSDYDKAAYHLNVPPEGQAPTPPTVTQPTTPVAPTPQPKSQQKGTEGDWILAKAVADEVVPDHNGDDHKIKEGQFVVLKNNNDGETWTYATVWKGKIQWHNSHMHKGELSKRFASVKGKSGELVKGRKASELAATTHVEEDKSFVPTDEQQDIADSFKRDKDNHMVINARAGTGKTTTLKQLAKQYSKGQKWLYLVFNSKNQQEAKTIFPKQVKVVTANSFGGEVINKNAKIIPHGQRRMTEIGGRGSGARLQQLTKGPQKDRYGDWKSSQYEEEVLSSLDMGRPMRLDSETRKYANKIKRKFNDVVMDVVGKAKGYGISPQKDDQDEDQHNIEDVMQLHLFDSEMDKIKEAIRKDEENGPSINAELSDYYAVDDFLSFDFEERMIKAAEWLLKKSAPGEHGEMFTQPSYDKAELLKIFAPGGQWPREVHGAFKAAVGRMKYNPNNVRNNDRMPNWDFKLKKAFEAIYKDQPQHSAKDFRDFDDDMWYLVQHADQLKWDKYDVVLVDEVQDFNHAKKVMVDHLERAGAKIVIVGDPQQGIYRFTGADHNSFSDMSQMLMDRSDEPEKVQKTLTKNWRSKHGIIDRANERSEQNGLQGDLQAGIEHDEHDPAHITDMEHTVDKAIDRITKEYQSLGELKKETAFICRNNQPLISAATQLIKNGIPFQVQGIDLGKEIKNLIDDAAMIAKLEDSSQFEEFDTGFAKYIEERKEELSSANTNVKEEFKEFETNVEAIINSMETYKDSEEIGTVKDFKNWMAKRLGGGKDGITLTTAHKSKGLEFDRVYDIAPSLYGSSPMLEKAYHKMEQIDRKVQAFEKMRPEGERTPEQEQELKKLKKKAKNYRLRYEGDASQENHAEYVVGTRGRHEHHALDDTKEEDDENL